MSAIFRKRNFIINSDKTKTSLQELEKLNEQINFLIVRRKTLFYLHTIE